jgi:ABC-type branched-subunit amino acid transport system ATPase component
MSGGEQQMLALGRAMISKPKLLLVDELSLGLAPLIVIEIYKQLRVIGETLGTAMLVVEQNANLALSFAQSAYLLQQGRVVLSGSAQEVAASPEMKTSSWEKTRQGREPHEQAPADHVEYGDAFWRHRCTQRSVVFIDAR